MADEAKKGVAQLAYEEDLARFPLETRDGESIRVNPDGSVRPAWDGLSPTQQWSWVSKLAHAGIY